MSTSDRKFANRGENSGPAAKTVTLGDNFFSLPELSGISPASAIPTAPSISLPKGGGAISGMGEKFDVDQSTGSGSISLPIQLSPARSGMQPRLSLNYNSGAGNGEFGLGWQLLGNGSITRKTSKGLPQYDDRQNGSDQNSDVFLISDAEDLVPLFRKTGSGEVVMDSSQRPVVDEVVYDNHQVRRFVPRVMQTFSRIERWTDLGNPDDVHWRALTPANHTMIFGRDSNSRIYDPSSNAGEAPRIFSWLQCEEYDPYGNAIVYIYKEEDSKNVPITAANEANRTDLSRRANRYLKTIKYGNVTPNRDPTSWIAFSSLLLPDNVWKFWLVLDYGEHNLASPTPTDLNPWFCRLDPFSRFHSGFEIRTYRLCQRLLMFHQFSELGNAPFLVASIDLTYRQDLAMTFLQSVKRTGYALDTTSSIVKQSLPALEFGYQDFSLDNLTAEALDEASLQNLPIGVDQSNYRWVDLDGEGLPGILAEQNGTWYYKRNTSANNYQTSLDGSDSGDSSTRVSARFSAPELLRAAPSASLSGRTVAHLGDVKGAGKLDVIESDLPAWGYFERELKSPTGWASFQAFRSFPNIDVTSKDVKFVDLTGDGLPDVFICEDQVFTWYPSLGADGYGPPRAVPQPMSEDEGPVCLFSDTEQTLYLADMSGDGLSDIVRIRNADICYWPNCGYGRFGLLVRMDNAPVLDHCDTYKEGRIRLADIDGSGTTDIIYLSADGINIYLNLSGNAFSDGKSLVTIFPIDDTAFVDTVDLLGNGTSCIVWSSAIPSLSRQPLRYIDVNRGKKPHLLNKVINNLGSEKYIHYAPSTKFYLDDLQGGNPWITSLPFPVHCVEKVEMLDRISQVSFAQRYSYHHGYYDGVEREFRGFARTDLWDSETFAVMKSTNSVNIDASWHVPPVRMSTWFHTGIFFGGDTWSQHLAHEYFSDPTSTSTSSGSLSGSLLPDTTPPPNNMTSDVLRESYRALKGHPLRKEVYSEDDSDKATIPYLIQEFNYTINVVQAVQDFNQHSVYSVFPREEISCHMERDPSDPRIEHSIMLDVDSFGNVKKAIKIVYGRRPGKTPLTGDDMTKQEMPVFLYSENDLTTPILSTQSDYRTPIPYETRSYQVSGFQPASATAILSFADFAGQTGDFVPLSSLAEIPFETQNDPKASQRRMIQKSRALFRADDLGGLLPPSQTGTLAIQGENYTLSFTPSLLTGIYKRDGAPLVPDPKTTLGGGISETKFGYNDLDNDGSWWRPTGRTFFSAIPNASAQSELAEARAHFFQPRSFVDQFGNSISVTYDAYSIFPVQLVDPVGNTVSATIDYRVLKHRLSTDPNGNQVEVAFDELGMVTGTAQRGKPGANQGDFLDGFKATLTDSEIAAFFAQPKSAASFALLGNATSRTVYNYNRYQESKQPVFAATISRVNHVKPPSQPSTDSQIQFSFSDGLGRIVQNKRQAKAGPLTDGGPSVPTRWVSSGWTVFNNKGNPVRQYQPFFDDTHDFKFDMKLGSSAIVLYDGLSRVVGTLLPDHTFTKTVFDGWSQILYDGNDNVKTSDPKGDPRADPDIGRFVRDLPEHEFLPSWYDARISGQNPFEQDAAHKAAAHANTPRVTHTDALGRVIFQVDDAGGGVKITQRINYDIKGQKREQFDGKNRLAHKSDFSMCGDVIHQSNMEAGESWVLPDVTGETGLSWNSRGFRSRYVRDKARRLIETWIMEGNAKEAMVHQNVYGELAPDAKVHNLLGILYQTRDQSGELTHNDLDFKGNLLSSSRKVAKIYKDTLNWSSPVELEDEVYTTTAMFDALNRPVLSTSPDSTKVYYTYNESGHVEQIFVNIRGEQPSQVPSTWTPMLSEVDHDARDQISTATYGNGVSSNWIYDPLTYRIQQVQTSGPATSGRLQDLAYTFDAAGNITHIQDQAQQTIFFRNGKIDASLDYTYDAIYRLTQAIGREHLGQTNGQPTGPTPPGPFSGSITDSPTDGNAMGQYTETYEYDEAGNIMSVAHALNGTTTPGWTRSCTYTEPSQIQPELPSNRLSGTRIGSAGEAYTYDAHGNITSMPHLNLMTWDFRDQLRVTSKQFVNTGTPETTYYVYDNDGKRIRKVTDSQSGGNSGPATPSRIKDRIYVGGWEVFRTFSPGSETPTRERVSMTIESESNKLCRINTRTIGTDNSPERAIRFELDNHLGSVCLTLDEHAGLVSYEEYFPFGGTAYESTSNQNDVPKRYRYCGKEKDDETGLYYYGGRYHAPWLGRWISTDPGGTVDGLNLYQFVRNNPIVLNDPDGLTPALAIPVAAVAIVGLLLIGTAMVISPPAQRKVLARGLSRAADAVVERAEVAKEKWHAFEGKIEDWLKPKPPPAIPAPAPPAPAPAPTTAPPVPETAPQAPPVPVAPPVPIAPPIPLTAPMPNAKPKTKSREEQKQKIKDRIKDISKELDEPDYEKQPFEQHHIYPQNFFWFFDKLGIDIDLAENLVLVPKTVHGKLHGEGWNPVWALFIKTILDRKAFDDSGGTVIKFINPFTHLEMSAGEASVFVIAAGKSLKYGLSLLGFGQSPVDYLGPDMKKRQAPIHSDLIK